MNLTEFKTFMLLDEWNYSCTDYAVEMKDSDVVTKTHRWYKDADSLEWYDDDLDTLNKNQAEIVYTSPSGLRRAHAESAISI